ncbi:MAG: hypothetical protein ACE5GW_09480, partial [Planctomycetota bacterium]
GRSPASSILSHCEIYGTRFEKGEHRAQVLLRFARLLVINNTRFFVDKGKEYHEDTGIRPSAELRANWRARYFQRVHTIIDEAVALKPPRADLAELNKLKGQCYWFSQMYPEAIAQYRKTLKEFPEDKEKDVTLCALINAHLRKGEYDEVARLSDEFLRQFPRSDLAPHAYGLKGKALTEGGKTSQALSFWRGCEETVRQAALGIPVRIGEETYVYPQKVRRVFQSYLDQLYFHQAFLAYVQGDSASALKALDREIDHLNKQLEKNLLSQAGKVFLDRSQMVRETLTTLQGRPAPSLDLGDGWLDGVALDLPSEKGNVIALLFAPYESDRWDRFLPILQGVYEEKWPEGLRVGWIATPKGRRDLPLQVERLRASHDRIGLSFPVGFDLAKEWTVYRAYNAAVGGATLVIIDRRGNLAWYKMDPTHRDAQIMRRVIDRLLEEPEGE